MILKNIAGVVYTSVFLTVAVKAEFLPEGVGQVRHSQDDDSVEFIMGADISFIPQIEDLGGVYKGDGIPRDPIQIFKEYGINYMRLKLWHTPDENYNNLEKILYMAARIKDKQLRFLLNFHYSDTWADPGKQYKPAAWEGLSFETLKDSVYQYTKKVLRALYDQQTLPDMVQIGNEITPGMLWNEGRVGGAFDTPQQWQNLGELISAGIRGVRESCTAGDSVRIMIHLDRGGDNGTCRWFFDNLLAQDVEFDFIGLSFYPWWHGTLSQVAANLNDLASRYDKDLVIVETAYPWTLQWFDAVNNIVGSSSDLHSGYPATIEGQKDFLRDLIQIVRTVQGQRGTGLFYWAPEYISVQPIGSPWENNALFDFEGNVLSSMDVFLEELPDVNPVRVTVRVNTATLMDTLGEQHFAQIRGEVSGFSYDTLPDGKKISWDSDSELILENVGGDYWEINFQIYPGDELSYKFWTGFDRTLGTFQRLGWEGPIIPAGGFSGNRRILVPGERDTVIAMQYYNSTSEARPQYWQPFESKADSMAVYWRVNMGKVMASGRFDPQVNGPVAVRGDPQLSGGSLDWEVSKVYLQREVYSVNNGSFWSGVGYIPRNGVTAGNRLEYKFFIENDTQNGWEDRIANRELVLTESLITTGCDTTIHWVYFDESDSTNRIDPSNPGMAMDFQLAQNYPNPFNNQTRIRYRLPRSIWVDLKVYNIYGELIAILVRGEQSSGNHAVVWSARQADGTGLVSGVYLVRLETEFGINTRKMLLLK